MREPPVELAAKTLSTKLLSCAQRPAAWTVVASAERIERKILDTYLQPDSTLIDLQEMAMTRSIDLFADFSEACRVEFMTLHV
jgi:hypothetical protein